MKEFPHSDLGMNNIPHHFWVLRWTLVEEYLLNRSVEVVKNPEAEKSKSLSAIKRYHFAAQCQADFCRRQKVKKLIPKEVGYVS